MTIGIEAESNLDIIQTEAAAYTLEALKKRTKEAPSHFSNTTDYDLQGSQSKIPKYNSCLVVVETSISFSDKSLFLFVNKPMESNHKVNFRHGFFLSSILPTRQISMTVDALCVYILIQKHVNVIELQNWQLLCC